MQTQDQFTSQQIFMPYIYIHTLTFPGIRLTATPDAWTVLSYLTLGFLCVCKLTMLRVIFPSLFFFLSPRTHIKVKK